MNKDAFVTHGVVEVVFISSSGTQTLISQSALPKSTTRPVMGSPLGGSGMLFTCRIRIVSVSTYSGLVLIRFPQPITWVGAWMWYMVDVGPQSSSVPKTSRHTAGHQDHGIGCVVWRKLTQFGNTPWLDSKGRIEPMDAKPAPTKFIPTFTL